MNVVRERAAVAADGPASRAESVARAYDQVWSNAALRLSKVIGALGERGSW